MKSSAYIQSWHQERPSKIQFDIAKKRRLDYATNAFDPDYPCRCADCYVFCLFTGRNVRHEDVLDTSLRKFYVLPAAIIEERFGEQKSVALSRNEEIYEAVFHEDLKDNIDAVLNASATKRYDELSPDNRNA